MRFDDSDGFLIANAGPQPGNSSQGKWNALVLTTPFSQWLLLDDKADGRSPLSIPGNEQFLLYRRGNPGGGD